MKSALPNPFGTELAELESLYRTAPVGLTAFDRELRCIRINERMAEFNGVSIAASVGRHLRDYISRELADMAEPLLRRVLETGEPLTGVEAAAHTASGQLRHYLVNYGPLRNAQNDVIGVSVVVQDVTEPKQALESARAAYTHELHQTISASTTGLTRCSRDLRYLIANPAYAQIAGVPLQQIIGRPIVEVMGQAGLEMIRPHVERVLAGESVEYEMPVAFSASGSRLLHVAYTPWREADGSVSGWIASVTDVSARRNAEDKLLAADKQKDQFISMLSHELRNPLASILNEAEVLDTESPSKSDVSSAARAISRQANHMARMLEDLLDASRIARHKLELRQEHLEIVKVIQSATEATHSLVEAGGHELVLTLPGAPLYVIADPTRLEQVFVNLISNAAKYTEPHGHIQVTCRREGTNILVSVKDNGIGIDPTALPALFQLFSQVRPSNGLGIGLWLVREIAELHGGSVEATSEGVGKGSEFRVRLPLAQTPQASAEQAQKVHTREDVGPKHRVLIVDDLPEVAESLARLLKSMGHDVRVAYDGVRAIQVGSEFNPDVILLDIGMPNLDGYQTCRQIRQQPWGGDIFIAALTGWAEASVIQKAIEAGFDRHLAKPVDRSTFANLFESIGSRARTHRWRELSR
jgi:PAS domain S-box-containing protein